MLEIFLSYYYLILYFGFILGFRTYHLYRKHGINTLGTMGKMRSEKLIESVMSICVLLNAIILINFLFIPLNYPLLLPFNAFNSSILDVIGSLLIITGLIFAFVAQFQMKSSWRLGLNRKEKPKLITKGMYNWSRNPIYLGIMMAYLGLFFLLPSMASIILFLGGSLTIAFKVNLEESYLSESIGAEYIHYCKSVRRWL